MGNISKLTINFTYKDFYGLVREEFHGWGWHQELPHLVTPTLY